MEIKILSFLKDSISYSCARGSSSEIAVLSMISDLKWIFYTCISKEIAILAKFNSVDSGLQTLALKCLKKALTLHSMFSHTIRERAYTFLLDKPHLFLYFGIFDEKMERSEALWFLNRVKESSSA